MSTHKSIHSRYSLSHAARSLLLFFSLILIYALPSQAQQAELVIPEAHEAYRVVISPDGKWMLSVANNGLKLWDYSTGMLLKNLKPDNKEPLPFPVTQMASSNQYAIFQWADTLYLVSYESLTITKKIASAQPYRSIAFSPDNKSIYLAGARENEILVHKYDVLSGRLSEVVKVKANAINHLQPNNLSFSPEGDKLLLSERSTGSWIINLQSNTVEKSLTKPTDIRLYTYLKDGTILGFKGYAEKALYAVIVNSSSLQPIKTSRLLFRDSYGISAVTDHAVNMSAKQNSMVVSFQGESVVVKIPSLEPLKKFTSPKQLDGTLSDDNFVMSANGSEVVSAGSLERFQVATGEVIGKFGAQPLNSYVQFVFKHANGIAMKDRTINFDGGNIYMRNFKNVNFNNSLYRLTEDGKTGFAYNYSLGLKRFDPNKAIPLFEHISKVDSWQKSFVGMQVFDKLGLLTLVGDDGVYVMDLQTLKLLYIIDVPFGMNYTLMEDLNKFVDISPDKTKMILRADYREELQEIISCVSLDSKDEIWNYTTRKIDNLRFSEDGRQIIFTSLDTLITLNAADGKKVSTTRLPSPYLTCISPSGKTTATKVPYFDDYGSAGDIALYNTAGGNKIGQMTGTGDPFNTFAFLKDERYLITAEGGGICLWDVQQRKRLGKLYLFENSPEWVFVAPDGRFDATPAAMKWMYYVKGKEVIPLESMYEKYYTPSLLRQLWDGKNDAAPVPVIENLKTPPTLTLSVKMADRNLTVEDDIQTIETGKPEVTIVAKADGKTDLVQEIRLYQNEKLIQTTRNLVVEDEATGEKNMTREFAALLQPGLNKFKGVAFNSQRTESKPFEIIVNYKPEEVKPLNEITLHMVIVGINQYKNPKYNLNYANADATAFEAAFKNGSAALIQKTNVVTLFDQNATKQKIKDAFATMISRAQPQDLFVFYYAGHGVINDQKEFFLVPHDVTQLYGNDGALAQNGVSAAELQEFSKNLKAQKQLFILDACQSAGAIEGAVASTRGAAEEKAIAQLARSTGTQWLTAAGSEQFATEFQQLGHGTFTYCILEGFKGEADSGDKKLTVKELDAYLQDKVPEVTKQYKGTPQYPSSYSYGNDFPIIIIK